MRNIAITSGEPAGIGPDLIADLVDLNTDARLVLLGDYGLIETRIRALNPSLKLIFYDPDRTSPPGSELEILHIPLCAACKVGELNPANAEYVLNLLRRACEGCLAGEFDAMVTAPVQKDIINQAGIPFTGHTEFLADICAVDKPVMLLTADNIRVALATIHMPLRAVPDSINSDLIVQICNIMDHDLRLRFGLPHPHIKVCGLNPHAGENGYLGHEEIEHIIPAIKLLRDSGLNISGPYPADTVFTVSSLSDADAVLAMYHDQGLPVLKHAGFHRAVNTTLGLPIIRTSVDHGTALDLAGTNRADSGSLKAAIQSASFQIECRNSHATPRA